MVQRLKEKIIFNFLSYGDLVIDIFIINTLRTEEKFIIFGSKRNKTLANLLLKKNKKIEYFEFLDDIPSFFNIKNSGIFRGLRSFIILFYKLKYFRNSKKYLYNENGNLKSKLLFLFTSCSFPKKNKNIYVDRFNCFHSKNITMKFFYNPYKNKKFFNYILINPHASNFNKSISESDLLKILSVINDLKPKSKILFIDFKNRYTYLKDKFYLYKNDPSFDFTLDLMNNTNFFIGPDSFLLHLSYLLKIPALVIYNKNINSYFAPPHLIDSGSYILSNDNSIKSDLRNFFTKR